MVVRWCEIERDGRPLYHGPVWRWHRNGRLHVKEYYLNGNAEGTWTSWQENGKPGSSGTFRAGRKIGTWKYRDSEGRLKTEVTHAADGNRWTHYYPSGRKRATGKALSSGKVGTWTYWQAAGAVKARCDFAQGLFAAPDAPCQVIADELDPKGFSRPVPEARAGDGGVVQLRIASQTFELHAPSNWTADTGVGARDQVSLVLLPRGTTWKAPGVTQIYMRVLFPEGQSLDQTIEQEREDFEASVADYQEHAIARGSLQAGQGYAVKTISYKPLLRTDSPFAVVSDTVVSEAVAFVRASDQVVLVFVLTCRDQAQLKDAMGHLSGVIESLRNRTSR